MEGERIRRDRLAVTGRWLLRRADDVAVVLMALMFVSFLLQIAFRYLLNQPLGWTEEVTVLCWLWVVLWCAALVLSDREEIRFDIVYTLVPARVQRAFTVVASLAFVVLLLLSLPASWNYVAFMKREHTAYLHMRLDFMYSIYILFVVACVAKHLYIVWRAITGRPLDDGPAVPENQV